MSNQGRGGNSSNTSNTQAIRQAGQTYNNSVDLRQVAQTPLQEQVARELMGRSITSEDQYVPRQPHPEDSDENTEIETRLVTIHPTELNENGDIRGYRSPKSHTFHGYKRQTEIYYHHLKDDLFVERRACEKGYEMLLKNNILILLGCCGDGRTTLGCWLLKKISEEKDCDAVRINTPKEWSKVLEVDTRNGEKLAVMMDDIFGSVGMAEYLFEEWRPNERYMWSYVEKKDVYLILTSRKHLFTQGVTRLPYSDLFNKKFVLDLTQEDYALTWQEKKKMLHNHMVYRGLDEDLAENLPEDSPTIGFPLLINQFCMVEDFQKWGLRFFTNPVLWYHRDLECVASTESETWGVLVLIMLSGGLLKPSDFNPYSDDKEKYEEAKKLLRYTSIKDDYPHVKVMSICEHIERVYIRHDKEASGYRFIDRHMEEAAMLVYGKYHFKEVVKRCTLDFLCEYIVTHRLDLDRPEKDILLVFTPSYYEYLSERFVQEVLAGNIERIVSHRAFLDDSFTEAFFKYLKEKDETVTVLQAKDKKCDKGLLVLCTMYGQEGILRQIRDSGVFNKHSSKEWVKNEREEAVNIAKEHKLLVMERMLKQL